LEFKLERAVTTQAEKGKRTCRPQLASDKKGRPLREKPTFAFSLVYLLLENIRLSGFYVEASKTSKQKDLSNACISI
jgi:hypothetical protein